MPSHLPGELVLLAFPFTDGSAAKRRPALILADAGDGDLLLARVTSQPGSTPEDVQLKNWQSAGLKVESWVRTLKLATMNSRLVDRRLGRLHHADWVAVCASIAHWQTAMPGQIPA